MLNQKFREVLELSNRIKAILNAIVLTDDNSKPLELAANLLVNRDIVIRRIFSSENEHELKECTVLLEKFLDCDNELQQISSTLKLQMSKQIIQQKRKTKATQAYIQK